jgi:hypothetical protein
MIILQMNIPFSSTITQIDKGFHLFYDQYLKTNQQKDGIESYSKFVNLLINFYKDKEIN